MTVKILNKCEDCVKQSVCKYVDSYAKDQNIKGCLKGYTTVITVECSEFSSKPKLRNCISGDRQDG